MKKFFRLASLAIALMFLSSCLTTEYKEYSVQLKKDGSGTGTVKFYNIVSQDDEATDVSADDFNEMMDTWINGQQFENDNPGLVVTEKKLYEENGVLCGLISFTFSKVTDLGIIDMGDCTCAPLLYILTDINETYVESNGEYLEDNLKKPVLKWKAGTKEMNFKMAVQSDLSNCRSLLTNYQTWESEKN